MSSPFLSTPSQVVPGRREFAVRAAIGFAGVFLPLAVQLAFLPLWLNELGFSPAQIGVLFAVPLAAKIVTTPLLLAWADRFGDRATLHRLMAGAAVVAAAGFLFAESFAAVLAISLALTIASGAAPPLVDAITLTGVRRLGFDYGSVRLWGSLAFVTGTLAAGALVASAGPAIVPAALIGTYAVMLATAFMLPRGARKGGGLPNAPASVAPSVMEDRTLVLAAAATALIGSSHAMFYVFSTIHWTGLGFSGTTIGTLWSIGVLAEVALFALAPTLLPRVSPISLLTAGGIAGIVRWTMFTVDGGVAFFAVNSLLHAGTFAATHLGLQRLIAERVDDGRQGAAQALSSAFSGPAVAAATFGAGWLYGWLGADAFVAMAAMCAAGLVLAILAQPQRAASGGDTIEPE